VFIVQALTHCADCIFQLLTTLLLNAFFLKSSLKRFLNNFWLWPLLLPASNSKKIFTIDVVHTIGPMAELCMILAEILRSAETCPWQNLGDNLHQLPHFKFWGTLSPAPVMYAHAQPCTSQSMDEYRLTRYNVSCLTRYTRPTTFLRYRYRPTWECVGKK